MKAGGGKGSESGVSVQLQLHTQTQREIKRMIEWPLEGRMRRLD